MNLAQTDLDEMVQRTEPIWDELKGARLFLTGATGFFGVWLVAALAHARKHLGIRVPLTLLSRDPDAARRTHGALLDAAGAEVARGDVRTFVFPAGGFTHVIHGATAASAALNAEDPAEMFDVIVEGTRRVLAHAHTSGCTRFLLLSSGAVYGPQPTSMLRIPETYGGAPSTLDVANAYAEGKRAAEHLAVIHARASGFELTIARGFAFVGPGLPLDKHFAIGNFVRDALAGGPIHILGDGTPFRSYMYGTDLAAWLWTLLVRGAPSVAYNVGSDNGLSLRDVADRVAHAAGVSVEIAKEASLGAPPTRYVPDTTLARDGLGLRCEVNLDEAIRRTLAFHRHDRRY